VIAERVAQFPHALHQRVVGHDGGRPDRGDQVVPAEETAGRGEQVAQQRFGLRTQRDGAALRPMQLPTLQVELETVEAPRAGQSRHAGPPGAGPDREIRQCFGANSDIHRGGPLLKT